MAPDNLGRREMDALDVTARQLGLWLLLRRPGASTWRLEVRRPKQAIRDGQPWVRRYVELRTISGREVARAARTLRRDLRRDPPESGG